MPEDLNDDKPTLVQVIKAWWHQATSHSEPMLTKCADTLWHHQYPRLPTWFNLNLSMDK